MAAAAGVSKATVSNVFNWPERVRPDLRKRVEEAARRLGYSGADPRGSLLSGGKTNALGIVPPGAFGIGIAFTHPYMRDFLAGVAEVCEAYGAAMHLVSGVGDKKARSIRNALVDGFIFNSLEEVELIEPVRRQSLPFVVMDADGGPLINSVRIDDRDGARQAAQHLVDLGHRRFAILTVLRQSGSPPILHRPGGEGPRLDVGYPMDWERLCGIAEVLATVGLSINDVPIVEVFGGSADTTTFGGALAGAALLFDNAPEATAVIALGDTQDLAVLAEAKRRNIAVPRDLSVVGFDDPPQLALADPPLTTVAQPSIEKGRVAARIIFEGGPARQVVLPVTLMIRNSTAPPRH